MTFHRLCNWNLCITLEHSVTPKEPWALSQTPSISSSSWPWQPLGFCFSVDLLILVISYPGSHVWPFVTGFFLLSMALKVHLLRSRCQHVLPSDQVGQTPLSVHVSFLCVYSSWTLGCLHLWQLWISSPSKWWGFQVSTHPGQWLSFLPSYWVWSGISL
jgi:hypothetical protein